jgi:osmotically-inducible protein OsmY
VSEQLASMSTVSIAHIDDEALDQQVYRALENIGPLSMLGSPLHVQVKDGVVTLRGVVATYLCRAQIVQAVCNVPGVQRVSDELWV